MLFTSEAFYLIPQKEVRFRKFIFPCNQKCENLKVVQFEAQKGK